MVYVDARRGFALAVVFKVLPLPVAKSLKTKGLRAVFSPLFHENVLTFFSKVEKLVFLEWKRPFSRYSLPKQL